MEQQHDAWTGSTRKRIEPKKDDFFNFSISILKKQSTKKPLTIPSFEDYRNRWYLELAIPATQHKILQNFKWSEGKSGWISHKKILLYKRKFLCQEVIQKHSLTPTSEKDTGRPCVCTPLAVLYQEHPIPNHRGAFIIIFFLFQDRDWWASWQMAYETAAASEESTSS